MDALPAYFLGFGGVAGAWLDCDVTNNKKLTQATAVTTLPINHASDTRLNSKQHTWSASLSIVV
jgi:hypothetical protein